MAESYPESVENTVGKGEIARYEQFLLFQQCFQKAHLSGASKGIIVWEWVKVALNPNTTNTINFWHLFICFCMQSYRACLLPEWTKM